ncbi:DUF4767 domain-containing protein [Enterococcus sp.]|uniref:DUF4767 domain-containing protein n=1 Tax=Enterococcus sp. TaxID=35783 RepID=UPI00289D7412|nr:DUF4767 domain-containing protein [Enterococcus sp.]
MKKMTTTWLLAALFVLAACGDTATSSPSDSSQTSSASSLSSTTASQSSTETSTVTSTTAAMSTTQNSEAEIDPHATPWNEAKAAQLRSFMEDWGAEMEQTYQAYSPGNNVDLYGLALPDGVLSGSDKWQAVIKDTPIDIAWSDTGESSAAYNLVAVYSDAETQDYLDKHVYFFTIHNGSPLVLVTSQNQGNDNDYLYFTETENAKLKEGFKQIIQAP